MEDYQLFQEYWNASLPQHVDELLASSLLEELLEMYGSSGRHYHNLSHIKNMLRLFEEHKRAIEYPSLVAFSIFYHDAIYDSSAQDNEEQSAMYAEACLQKLGVKWEDIAIIKQFIIATKTHQVSGGFLYQNDLSYLLDLDLAILSADWPTYKNYAKQIREEYRQYGHIPYHIGRQKVLKHFLKQPSIYKTPSFQKEKETIARKNLTKEIRWLQWRLFFPFI